MGFVGYLQQRLSFVDQEIEAAFSELIHTPWSRGRGKGAWQPSVDLHESDEAYILIADLPGLEPESIHLEAQEHTLTICGERKLSVSEKSGKLVIFERSTGRFCRSLSFSEAIDHKNIKVTYEFGIYKALLPKKRVHATQIKEER